MNTRRPSSCTTPTRANTDTNESDGDYSDGEDTIHGVCNSKPVGADKDRRDSRVLVGTYVAKLWLQTHGAEMNMYTGKVNSQETKQFDVKYNDGVVVKYSAAEVEEMQDFFELWYQKLNTGIFTRAKACGPIRQLYERHKVEEAAKEAATAVSASQTGSANNQ